MSAEFNNHPLLDLEKLFLDDPLEILRLQQAFETNGWCFVRLSQNHRSFATQLNHINQSLSNFFALDPTEKSRYLSSNAFGYSRVDHKEGIKILTDQHGITDSQSILPMSIEATLQHLSRLINDLTYHLKPIITKLTVSDDKSSNQVELSAFAMLDIVHYFNKKTGSTKIPEVGYNTDEVNCVPHYDPGLFSLSILSTCDGLQLKDQRENKWIDGPNNSQVDQSNIGVIWLGAAASILTGNRFKSGIHRVIYPRTPHQARLTIWQEVCTEDQIKQLFEQNNNVQLLPADAKIILANQPDSLPMNVLPGGETPHAFMKRVESRRGLSMSKSVGSDIRLYSTSIVEPNLGPPPSKNKKTFSFLKTKK
ncbi:unnamed protein product [Rotaria sp. Silwood1]|nr:unnamed protein product [Rotaria sp. Silwood1]CAF3340927.1 unnamed protein product [Rotaria sp. Silwood1]CAF3344383.1 unnamed protein product [Rotaria sp. Silwood1]CAF4569494.1 unnamed protein product [Rotaria sp. Silwood1]CAF4750531.1 unnamed protein product [Rotaria sp. Silwood1]